MNFIYLWIVTCLTSIYSFSFQKIDGGTVSLSEFEGKKMLLVNIATNSQRAMQLTALQQLHAQYGDSLVIIGFPSNSFNNEPLTAAQIFQTCSSQYGVNFLLAMPGSVKGPAIQPIFKWLTDFEQNGTTQGEVQGDFQKFLIDEDGEIVGLFAGGVSPTDSTLTDAISRNYHSSN